MLINVLDFIIEKEKEKRKRKNKIKKITQNKK